MVKVCAYNIRGLNKGLKKADLHSFLVENNISMIGILETRVKVNKASAGFRAIHNFWRWEDNYQFHSNGRIWLGWNPNIWNISVESKSAQYIHCKATLISSQAVFLFTFIYASNFSEDRLKLWADLASLNIQNHPWSLLGDFNTVQDIREMCGGSNKWTRDMQVFKDFLVSLGLSDIRNSGTFYTWWNKQTTNSIMRKLDRVLGNSGWMSSQQNADVIFTPWGLSDHSASILNIQDRARNNQKTFQFYNYWLDHPDFLNTVREVWNSPVNGNPIYILSQKLGLVKRRLNILKRNEGSIHTQIKDTRARLCSVQSEILNGCQDSNLIQLDRDITASLSHLLEKEENIARQRSRVQWLELGDNNTSFFHKKIASNWNSNKITSLIDASGLIITDETAIKNEAVSHFHNMYNQDLLDYPGIDHLHTLISKRISPHSAQMLTLKASDEEIYGILKSMKRNKTPGPDGFNVNFFIHTWDIIGKDFLEAVHYFLETGHLPHYANSTVIALIPKCRNPSSMTDFRPISCCNTLYKCISKLIAKRFSNTLPNLIDRAQAAFVKGRNISDNILLAQEVFKGYNSSRNTPKAAFKLDLHKAFDSCHWQFIFDVLILRGYPFPFIRWVHSCLTTAQFSVKVNGVMDGYFSSSRGIRQGDPLSPFLFVLIMDALSEMLQNLAVSPGFKFHKGMEALSLNHLIFADDLLMFCNCDRNSISLLMDTLECFKSFSGLAMNPQKSTCYLSNPPRGMQSWIQTSYNIGLGQLPAKFLGVPLVTKKLSQRDCHELIAKLANRIESWTTHFLSFAGRMQLIKAVLNSIYSYWGSHFMLPKGVLKIIQSLFSRFLWNGHAQGPSKAKIAWTTVTLPMSEGGLGIKDVCEWNKALILKHLIAVIRPASTSLWADWVHKTIIKDSSFWIISKPSHCSWILRKVLDLRSTARQFLSYKIGNGLKTSFWFDPWYNGSPICSSLYDPIISQTGLNRLTKVANFLTPSGWSLPTSNYHGMIIWRNGFNMSAPFNLDKNDDICWNGIDSRKLTISDLWQSIRHAGNPVNWANSVWHRIKVPRFSFLHWQIMHNRINTLSRLRRFNLVASEQCYFCINGVETIGHLFLECPFTCHVLSLIFSGKGVTIPYSWDSWRQEMQNFDNRDILSTLKTLVFQTTCYYIWKERNTRFHEEESSNTSNLAFLCNNLVRCRLQSSGWFLKECENNQNLAVWIDNS